MLIAKRSAQKTDLEFGTFLIHFIHSAFPFAESITALNSIDIPQIGLTLFFSLYSLDDAVLVASGMV